MDGDKALTYEDAKRLCRMAFDAGADYARTCSQYNCNAVAYDWDHWLKRNERLFMPAPTVEDVLREFAKRWDDPAHYAKGELVETFAAKLKLDEDNSGLYPWERDE